MYICKSCCKMFDIKCNYTNHKCEQTLLKQYLLQQCRVVDLCAGTGAFSFVFEKMFNAKIVFANDYDKGSKQAYDINFSHKLSNENIHNIDSKLIPVHDILCAGFPCQSFSLAGLKEGFNDVRANVFFKIIDIMKYHQPKIVILENVKNLISHDKGMTFKRIQSEISNAGYHYKYQIINTSKVTGIPQCRERIYIICMKRSTANRMFNFVFPEINKKNIVDFLDESTTIANKYWYGEHYKIFPALSGMTKDVTENVVYQFRRYYVRENKGGCCPTLTANMGTGGHNVPLIKQNGYIRKLTPKECFRLQGFPNDYIIPKCSDSILYKLAGNAVTIPVIKLIIDKICDCIIFT